MVEALRYKPEGRGFYPHGVFDIFRSPNSSARNGPGVDSASNINEYQGSSLGGKGDRCVGLTTLPPICADCLKIVGAPTSWISHDLSKPVQGQQHFLKRTQEKTCFHDDGTMVFDRMTGGMRDAEG